MLVAATHNLGDHEGEAEPSTNEQLALRDRGGPLLHRGNRVGPLLRLHQPLAQIIRRSVHRESSLRPHKNKARVRGLWSKW